MAAGLESKAANTAGEILLMRADILIDIIAARMRLMQTGTAPARGSDQRRRNSDGGETVQINSFSGLSDFLKGKY